MKIFHDEQSKVSAHFVIAEEGEVIELVPCTHRAWHAGESKWEGWTRFNDISIGVELINRNGNIFPYSSKQMTALKKLIEHLQQQFPALKNPRRILGHEHIAGYRGKIDPGIYFNWGEIAQDLRPLLPVKIELNQDLQNSTDDVYWQELNASLEKNLIYPSFGKQVSNWAAYKKHRPANIQHFVLQFQEVDVQLAQAAFQQLVIRHESLRAVFRETSGEVVQIIMPYNHAAHSLRHVVCRDRMHFERKRKALTSRIDGELGNLEEGPLFRAVIYEVANTGYLVEISIHHIISDAWTVPLIRRELLHLYRALATKTPPQLQPVQLKKYICDHHSQAINEQKKAFWLERLKDLPPVDWKQLVTKPRFTLTDENIERALNHTYGYTYSTFINADETAKIRQVSVKYNTTFSIVVMAGFLMLMRSLFSTDKIFIISRLNGRFHAESHDIIGNLTCAVYSLIHEQTGTAAEAIKLMHNDLLDCIDYAIYNPLLLSELPLTTHCHLCVNIITDDDTQADTTHNKLIRTPVETYFPLEVAAVLRKDSIVFNWIYNTCLFRSNMIRAVAQRHTDVLQKISKLS